MNVKWGNRRNDRNVVLGKLLASLAALLVASGLWYLIIWGAVEGWKHVGK